jgi:dienelactone hydrolase
MAGTRLERETLSVPDDPPRLVRVRVERPAGEEGAPRAAVLILHGFKGFMDWGFFPEASRRLAEAGLVVVSMNASGSGIGDDPQRFTEEEAFAKNTFSKELEDLEFVRSYTAGLPGVDPARLAVCGHSRGGGVVLLHADRHGDYRAVVTWAALSDIDRMDEATKAGWRERGHLLIPNARTGRAHRVDLDVLLDAEANREALDILAACTRLTAPTLVVHGTADEVVSFAESERIVAALPRPLHRPIKGAGHAFGATHPLTEWTADLESMLDATRTFLLEHL